MVAINGRVANHVHFLYRIGSCKSPFTICINISGSKRSNRVARFTQRACAWSEPFSRRNESQDFAIFNFILFSKVGVELVHNRIVRKKLWNSLLGIIGWSNFILYQSNTSWIEDGFVHAQRVEREFSKPRDFLMKIQNCPIESRYN